MTINIRTPKQKGKNKIVGSTKVSKGWGLAHRTVAKAQNLSAQVKLSGEVQVLKRLKVDEPVFEYDRGFVQRTRKFLVSYNLRRTPWGEGLQVVGLKNAEPRYMK